MSLILIISDTHYLRKNELDKFIHSFKNIEAVIHCGDIYLGYQPGDIQRLYLCKGNNDFADIPKICHFTIDDVKFTITHGHMNNYAYNPLQLKNLLDEYPSDVICFGHTHIPYYYQDDDVTIINPGSLSLGRTYPRKNTYVLYDTKTKECSFYDFKTNKKVDLQK